MRNYLFNGYRRLSGEFFFFAIPFAVGMSRDIYIYIPTKLIILHTGYATYSWAKSYDEYQNSKAGHIASGGHHE